MSRGTTTTLRHIIDHKRAEVARAKAQTPIDHLKEMISELGRPRNFFQAVVRGNREADTETDATIADVAVIAEIKRKSPSAGWIRPEYERESFDPVPIARQYHANGAAAISCLTDDRYFAGKLSYIHAIRDAVPLPVLRKDFIIDPWQIWESRAHGADAVLLIAEALDEAELIDLMILARELQLTSLIEVHSMDNLLRVRPHVGFPSPSYWLLGINNRDLATMTTSLAQTLRLVDLVEDTSILVSESGIEEPAHLARLATAGVRIALVGESLMRTDNPGNALAKLLQRKPAE